MICDALYAQAFAFKNTKLWKRLSPEEMFAVQLSGDEIAYVSIDGQKDDLPGIKVEFGDQEWIDEVRISCMLDKVSELRQMELFQYANDHFLTLTDGKEIEKEYRESVGAYAKRNHVSLKGQYSYPIFVAQKKLGDPQEMPEDEQEKFCRILEAVLEVNRKVGVQTKAELGFRTLHYASDAELLAEAQEIPLLISTAEGGFQWSKTKTPEVFQKHYAETPFENEDLAKRLREAEKQGSSEFMLIHVPIEELEPDESMPLCLVSLHREKKKVMISSPFDEDPETESFDAAEMLDELGEDMLSEGNLPQTITVADEREEMLLKQFAAACGFEMRKLEEDTPEMEDAAWQAISEILEQLEGGGDDEDDEDGCDCGCDHEHEHHHHHHHDGEDCDCDCEDEENLSPEDFIAMMEMLGEMPDEVLKTMPKDLRMTLKEMDREGILPEKVRKKIAKYLK